MGVVFYFWLSSPQVSHPLYGTIQEVGNEGGDFIFIKKIISTIL